MWARDEAEEAQKGEAETRVGELRGRQGGAKCLSPWRKGGVHTNTLIIHAQGGVH
jgi:hypothetical protein